MRPQPPSPFDIRLYQKAVRDLPAEYADLTAWGFTRRRRLNAAMGTGPSITVGECLSYPPQIVDRAAMFRRSIAFLNDAPFDGVIRTTVSSYGLKHWAERPDSYIENGVMILALIHLGWKFKLDIPNANVAVPADIRKASLKAAKAKLRAADRDFWH